MHASPPSRGRRALTALTALLAGLALPAAADGATYQVRECHSGSSYAVDGMVGSYVGAHAYHFATCDSASRFLGGSFNPTIEHAPGDLGQVTVSAPSGTTLAAISGTREAVAGPARAYGAPLARLFTDLAEHEVFAAVAGYQASGSGPIDVPLGGASLVGWGVLCAGNAGCPAGDTRYVLRDVTLTLNDSGAPSVSQVAGPLRSESSTARTRSLTYAASDAGSGVFRHRLIVDGSPRPAETVDANEGSCAPPFARRVPCQRDVTGTVTLDTSALADGHHDLQLDVRDATDVNKALYGPWTIFVDNQPPTIAAPTLTGVAREADTLTCAAEVQGQSPTVTFQWLRSAPDGSGALAIPGATNAAYTAGSADVGRKLICRVTARDGGGSASRDSLITQEPFDNGRTVAEYCDGRPSGPRDECGDLDRDGTPNRVDGDIDGDGVANASDPDPYDAAKPGPGATTDGGTAAGPATPSGTSGGTSTGPGGTSTTPGGTSPSGPATATAATAPPLGSSGTVRFLLGRHTATFVGRRARWARSGFALAGRLTDAGGRPLSGLRLSVSQSVGGRNRRLGETTTSADGSWSFRVPRGPSRTITVSAGDSLDAARMTVRQTVRAHVTLRSVTKRIRRGGAAVFRGQLRGGYVNAREKLVEFQVHYRGAWRTIANLKVNRAGRFTVRYRFGTASYGRYAFRARTLPTDGYPFAVGTSSARTARVKVG